MSLWRPWSNATRHGRNVLMNKAGIAVFGGAFNPPTVAHIDLAKQILKEMKEIEKVIFVPVSTKYNKL